MATTGFHSVVSGLIRVFGLLFCVYTQKTTRCHDSGGESITFLSTRFSRLRDNACTTLLPVLLVSANCVSALALDLVTSPRDDEAGDYHGRACRTQTSAPNWSYLNIVMHAAFQPRHFQQTMHNSTTKAESRQTGIGEVHCRF